MISNKLKRVLDQVQPSPEWEKATLKRLLTDERTEHNMKKIPRPSRLAAALAAAALMLTTGAFAVVTGLDQRLLNYFGGSSAQEELLSAAAMVVDREIKSHGAALHVRQVVADRYSALVLMDFAAPEGTVLDQDYYGLGGKIRATAPDGTKMSTWGSGWTLLEDEDPRDNRITLLFSVRALDDGFNFLGATLSLDFEGLYRDTTEKDRLAEGRWPCSMTLPTEDPGRYVIPDLPIEVDGNQVTLSSLYISPISFAWELAEGESGLKALNDTGFFQDREDWWEQVFLTTQAGGTIPVGEPNYLFTQYKTDILKEDRGRYCFRLQSVIDPETVTSVTLFGQEFPLD